VGDHNTQTNIFLPSGRALSAGVVAVVVAVAVGLYMTFQFDSAPLEGRLIRDGEVERLGSVHGVRLREPADGRLRNVQTALTVTGLGTGDAVADEDGAKYRADDGRTLLVIGVRADYVARVEGAGGVVRLSLVVASVRLFLPQLTSRTHPEKTATYYVTSYRDGSDATLVLNHPKIDQEFDLREGRRVGSEPNILYRFKDRASWYKTDLGTARMRLAAPNGNTEVDLDLKITYAMLTYYTTNVTPAQADEALLVLAIKNPVVASDSPVTSCDLPLSAFTLAWSGGTAYSPKPDSSMTSTSAMKVVFEVPANLQHATMKVSTNKPTCRTGSGPERWTTERPARISITVPAK
jgi:hypothetical protein